MFADMMPYQYTKGPYRKLSLADRFWPKVFKTEECWIWTAATKQGGYGVIGNPGKGAGNMLAHRVSWSLHFGDIPEGLCVCHRCNTPPCVNPNHLYLATNEINLKDAWRDGLVPRHPRKYCPQGHEYTPENCYFWHGKKHCRQCGKESSYRQWKKRQKLLSTGKARKDHM